MKVLYEPWGLGDACIAVSAAIAEGQCAVACRSIWHEIINVALFERGYKIILLTADPPHGLRGNSEYTKYTHSNLDKYVTKVISIRGDPRDLLHMRRRFANAKLEMTGWSITTARYLPVIDRLITKFSPVKSRYYQWADALKVERSLIATAPECREKIKSICIHVGAQWKSKQYPYVAALRLALNNAGCKVEILAGPGDPLPESLSEIDVNRCAGSDLVKRMKCHDLVVTNDSGPMHVAHLADIPYFSIFGTANAGEWAPPGARYCRSSFMPNGYRSAKAYSTDRVLVGWPTAVDVASKIIEI